LITPAEFARRRRQLMHLAGEDAVQVADFRFDLGGVP